MKIYCGETYKEMSDKAASIIASQVTLKPDCVLGLATGSTPIGTYKCLVEKYNSGDLDFSKVRSINLDEYRGLSPENDQSYRYFMNDNLFNHVNINKENTYVPDGTIADAETACKAHEDIIRTSGGIDLQLLGIGGNGHIAFNDPPVADFNDPKAVKPVQLDEICRNQQVNDGCFAHIDQVPKTAITLTVPTLTSGDHLFCIVPAATKAKAVKATVCGEIGEHCPATALRRHKSAVLYLDGDSSSLL